jgi:hypothetical protein
MPQYVRVIGLLLQACLLLGWPALLQAYNPKPAPDDLLLPMPNGESMVFRPIFIGTGDAPFALRRFTVGDPGGGFKEFPTAVALGGAFVGTRHGTDDRLYYMGKYEVTEAQYYALTDLPPGAAPDLKTSNLPRRDLSWTEVLQFIDRYNRWLFANAPDRLPENDGIAGFLRLPTEVEWEFAARGGAEVDQDEFDRKLPYTDNLAKYEWFAGPKSSHNKVKAAGMLEPNVLGLHDMLGNVAEMTHSLYRVEYYQGQAGGFVARGGHYLTSEKQLRSSRRVEEPFYLSRAGRPPEPNHKPTLGFRLVLSSVVYPNRQASRAMASAWEAYRAGHGAKLPAAVSVGSTSSQTQVHSEDSLIYLGRLKRELQRRGLTEAARQELGLLEASLANIRVVLRQAAEDSAYAWAKISAERGFFIYRELRKLPTLQRLLAVAQQAGRTAMVKRYQVRMAEFSANITQALSTYSESLRQLDKVDPEAIESGFSRYRTFLQERHAQAQLRVLPTVRDHFDTFNRGKRADPDSWRQDFIALGQEP